MSNTTRLDVAHVGWNLPDMSSFYVNFKDKDGEDRFEVGDYLTNDEGTVLGVIESELPLLEYDGTYERKVKLISGTFPERGDVSGFSKFASKPCMFDIVGGTYIDANINVASGRISMDETPNVFLSGWDSYSPDPRPLRISDAPYRTSDSPYKVTTAGSALLETLGTNSDEPELVDHPQHYNTVPDIECIDVIKHFDFRRGNVIKYVWRAGEKPGEEEIRDLKKAVWYLESLIADLEEGASESADNPSSDAGE